MRLAFDLDDTLVPTKHTFTVEPPYWRWWGWLCRVERMRHGTRELLAWLNDRGIKICVYTSSLRSPAYIHRLFGCYGVRLDRVINGDIHIKKVVKLGEPFCYLFKYPPAFGIDILVDDSEGVQRDGKHFNFPVIVVPPQDEDWVNTVKRGLW